MEIDNKVNILLVDDNPSNLLALESILSELGENIIKANSGHEALKQLLHKEFSVILLDVNMPGIDGFETASLIRKRKKSEHTPIIFVTAINTTDSHVSLGYSLGAVDYIFTPVVPEILKSKVTVFVELYKKTDQLKKQAEDLVRSNHELEQFAYLASHDLQEPLRMVGCYTQLLAKRYKNKLDSEADQYISFTVDGVRRMQALVNDILTYSRAGRIKKDFEPISCQQVLTTAIANLKFSIDEAQAIVTYDSLPGIVGDSNQLVQVFQNLIGNSLKFRGKEAPQVHISIKPDGAQWIFSVSDNGIGIDPKHFERIFLIFQRLHNRTQYPGTGIGLAITKKIIEYHGGQIWVESRPSKGATFYFTLPRKEK